MDTSAERRATDTLGRRTGPRRRYTAAEKRAIVEQTQVRGASVAEVAQRHGINANVVFGWRRLYKRGLLNGEAPIEAPPLLPVQITTPTVVPSGPVATSGPATRRRRDRNGAIEIEFTGGVRVRVHGGVDRATLARVIAVLSGR
jgi:transposase